MLLAGAHAGLIVFIEQGRYSSFLSVRSPGILEGAVPFVVPGPFTAASAGRADRLPCLWLISLYFEKLQVLY